ncbi:hypothetical protein THOM_1608 [Trachipleistophora hominis]|uniref:Uncharacterized protein n=1 Tax=Trachipleistophora hominis TaxID=72359 RepID=L7JVT3_TRAHO|nr:hypothetical protein THOM_1608 [Trachipleistophora hominis]
MDDEYEVFEAKHFLEKLRKKKIDDETQEKNRLNDKNNLVINRGIVSVMDYFKKYYF